MKKDKSFASLVQKKINSGKLLPDSIINKLAQDYFKKNKIKDNFIFDGYPRTLSEARFVAKHFDIDYVIELKVSDKEILRRILSRVNCGGKSYIIGKRVPVTHAPLLKELQKKRKSRKKLQRITIKEGGPCPCCSGTLFRREDDAPLKIKTRLNEYNSKTKKIFKFFKLGSAIKGKGKPKVISIDGEGSVSKIQKDVERIIYG